MLKRTRWQRPVSFRNWDTVALSGAPRLAMSFSPMGSWTYSLVYKNICIVAIPVNLTGSLVSFTGISSYSWSLTLHQSQIPAIRHPESLQHSASWLWEEYLGMQARVWRKAGNIFILGFYCREWGRLSCPWVVLVAYRLHWHATLWTSVTVLVLTRSTCCNGKDMGRRAVESTYNPAKRYIDPVKISQF